MCEYIKTFLTNILQTIFLISFFLISMTSIAQKEKVTYPAAEPEVGNDFTDDYKVILGSDSSITSLIEIDRTLNSGAVENKPWSNSYWPVHKGLIATRYADSSQPNSKKWSDYHSHYLSRPSAGYIHGSQINALSPAEKYDLLVGDNNWSLTKFMWEKGKKSMLKHGAVATWTGICHGWAAASQLGIPRPQHPVIEPDVTNFHQIKFYQFDIMALTSYYYANTSIEDRFTGRRCRKSNPSQDNGRITDGSCFDANPMTWHLSVVNRVGEHKKSFILDTSSNTEVWNYVIDSYETQYYNPLTGEVSANMNESLISRENYPNDIFSKYRSEGSKYIVGVIMAVYHPAAISPHTGDPSEQLLEAKQFIYELELNAKKEIIGGEWVSDQSPDFIWLLPLQNNPFYEPNYLAELESVSDKPVISDLLAKAARKASERGRILPEIMYRILHKSFTTRP